MDPCRQKKQGRPYGGVAVLWRKEVVEMVKEIRVTENRRIINVEVIIKGQKYYFLSAYAPCEGKGVDDNFNILDFWGQLNGEIGNIDCENIVLGGDFNTDYKREGFFLETLKEGLKENDLIIGDRVYFCEQNKWDQILD